MKSQVSFFYYIFNYETVNKFIIFNFLVVLTKSHHQTEVIYYILSQVMS